MTAIRSPRASTSSSSVETMRTAVPSSRFSTIRRWMYSIEPTSRPRVGWAASEELDRAAELAGHDHLLLVAARQVARRVEDARRPDVELADEVGRGGHDRVAVEADAVGERLEVVRVEDDVLGDREGRARARTSGGPPARGRRRARRSGAGWAAPRRRRSGSMPPTVRRIPVIASTSSVWPLPWTPATATISPARTTRSRSRTAALLAVVVDGEARDLEHRLAPASAGPLSTSSSTGRPTIIWASDAWVASAGSAEPTTLPRRRTVIRSAISRTSLSLWVMKMIDVPAALSDRMISKSSSVSCGVRTADGSSRMTSSDLR